MDGDHIMSSSLFRFFAIAVTALTCASPSGAMVVKGTFQGTAYASRIDATSPMPRDFDGEVVTGSFSFDTAGLLPPEANVPGFYWGFVQPGTLELVFTAAGQTAVFGRMGEGGDAVFASNGADGPVAELYPGYLNPYYKASLQLAGPLFDAVDLTTFRPDDVDLANSTAYFFAGREFGAMVALTEVNFVVRQIPEPASAWLVLAGLAVLAGCASKWAFPTRSSVTLRTSFHARR